MVPQIALTHQFKVLLHENSFQIFLLDDIQLSWTCNYHGLFLQVFYAIPLPKEKLPKRLRDRCFKILELETVPENYILYQYIVVFVIPH